MRCLAVCHDELLVRTLQVLLPQGIDVGFIVTQRPLAKRLHDEGADVTLGDPTRTATWLAADIGPTTCVLIEDSPIHKPARMLEAARDAGADLMYLIGLGTGATEVRAAQVHADFPDAGYVPLPLLCGTPLREEFLRSQLRARVQQYQRHFADADRVLILLHNEPDPDAMASGLALRNVLHRTKTTAHIGAVHGVSRPENLRMVHHLDIHIEPVALDQLHGYDRIALVDVQPSYFGGALTRMADLVVDHHPLQHDYHALYSDIRTHYGSTCTILTEHLRAVDANISERTATAMLYAIKSDTLFFSRQTNDVDIEAFAYLYPLADSALVTQMEGTGLTEERLGCVLRAHQAGRLAQHLFCAYVGDMPREDFLTFAADFFLRLEGVKWTVLAGVVDESLIVSVRAIGYSRHAGDFVKRTFGAIGSAGGHRSMAKAVVPVTAFLEQQRCTRADIGARIHALAEAWVTEAALAAPPERRSPTRSR